MNQTWTDVHNDIRTTDQPDKVLALLGAADTYEEDTRWRVLSSGLDRLWDLEYLGFEDVLLEQCALRSGYEGYHVHSTLQRWLKENSNKRGDVIRRLVFELDSHEQTRIQNVLWTLIVIGYRDQALEGKLLSLVNNPPNETTGHIALWGLVCMGYEDHTFLEDKVESICQHLEELPELITRCGSELASIRLLPYFTKNFLRNHFSSKDETNFIFAIHVLADTAQAHPELASDVWDTILQRETPFEDTPDNLVNWLSFWTGIAENIDDERVVDFFLHKLEPDPPALRHDSNRMSSHYRPYLRLLKLDCRKHLAAMPVSLSRADELTQERVLASLHQDAATDTRNTGFGQTELSTLKENSWGIILRLGLPEARQWIVEALSETSHFTAADVCNLAGYLRVTEAIPKLQSWIIQDGWNAEEGLHISLGLAALRALGNIGTLEAFEALTQSRVSLAAIRPDLSLLDATPRDYCDAFTACALTMQDVAPLIACLEQCLPDSPRCWVACVLALQEIAFSATSLVEPFNERVFALLNRAEILETEHLHFLIPTLGVFDRNDIVEKQLVEWARSSEHYALEATEVLAQWGTLHLYPDLLEKIGLKLQATEWIAVRRMNNREAFVTSLLFKEQPHSFVPAICDLIENGFYQEAVQVFQQLTPENSPPAIIEALSKRAYKVNDAFRAESEALWTLCRVAPNRFTSEFSYQKTCNWHAAARDAVVKAYRKLDSPLVADNLTQFLSDPVFSVRRTAARILSKIDASQLHCEAVLLMRSGDAQQRIYGIEAGAWLPEEMFQYLLQQAQHDRESIVRNASDEAIRERRRVLLAADYLPQILETPADRLPTTWQYGQAIQHLGDDETLRLLHQATTKSDCSPNRRAYLVHLHEEVEKGWKEWQDKRKDRLKD